MGEIPLNACKLVEETESGELVLLKENLNKLIEHWCSAVDVNDTPIALVSVLGPKLSGKSFYTNLLTEYLKHDGKTWTQSMKTNGLKGFPYGPDDNRVRSFDETEQEDVLQEEIEMGNGVYFWPKLFPLKHCNGEKLLLVMHLHRNRGNGGEGDEQQEKSMNDSLNVFVGVASSRILDIIWKGMSVATSLSDETPEETKHVLSYLCQSIVHLERRTPGGNEESKESIQKGRPTKDSVVTLPEFSTPVHNQKGITSFSASQHRAVDRIMGKMTEETLTAKTFGRHGDTLKMRTIENFLQQCVDLVNFSRGFNTSTNSDWNSFIISVAHNNSNSRNVEPEGMNEHQKSNSLGNNAEVCTSDKSPYNETTEDNAMDCSPPIEGENQKPLVKEKLADPEVYRKVLTPLIWPKLLSRLMQWITANLTRENIVEIKTLFGVLMDGINHEEILYLKSNGMMEEDAIQFTESVRRDVDNSSYENVFLDVEKALHTFCTNIEEVFSKTAWFPPDNLTTIFNHVKGHIIEHIGPADVVAHIFEYGTSKIIPFYESYNHRRMNEEKGVGVECIQQIRSFYQEAMENVAPQNQITSPKKLVEIHNKLFSELQPIFKESIGSVVNMSGLLTDLERHLTNDFREVERRNMRSIEMIQKKVINLIFKAKSEYETKMDELFEKNPDGIPKERFEAEDTKTEKETIHNFKMAIMAVLSDRASLDKHLLTLNYYIDQSRECLQEENDANLEETMTKTKTTNAGHSQTLENKPLETGGSSNQSPLLIQLGTEKVGIGIIRKDTVDVHFIPPVIGITEKNEWICGNELENLAASSDHHLLTRQWNVGDCLLDKQSTPFEEANLNDVTVQITTEFLLAVFLRSIKQAKENEYQMSISELKITVPFWCPSPRRQQVLDAAQITGFNDVHLISENSASAYYMYQSGKHDAKYSTIVLSVNSNMLDATVYSFDPQKKSLLMLSHCGDCDTKTLPPKRNQNWLMHTLYSLFSLLSRSDQSAPQGEKVILDKMRQMCEKAVSRAESSNFTLISWTKNVLISCKSTKWLDLLIQVTKDLRGSSEKRLVIDECAAIYGMASIHEVVTMNNIRGLSAETIIREGMPFYVNVYPPHGRSIPAFIKRDTFSRSPKRGQGICYFPILSGNYWITQENSLSNSDIANFRITNRNNGSTGIAVTLRRSHQGIVSLATLEWSRRTSNSPDIIGKVGNQAYEWINCSMTDEDKAKYISLMDFANFHNNLVARLAKEKKSIEKSCKTIIDDINNGKGNFKSSFAKKLVLAKVNETMQELGNLEQVTENELKQKREILKNILSTYNLS